MAEINNKFKVKKGLDVVGDTTSAGNLALTGNGSITGNLDVTGPITTPTLDATENSTKVATTQFVRTAIANLIASSPATLDTLNEIAQALGNDPNFATTMTNQLALKAPLASPALTGVPTAPTAAPDTNTTQIATAAFVLAQGSSSAPLMDGTATIGTSTRWARADHIHPTDTTRAPLASPGLTGTPTAPTAATATNTTQIATTAYVKNQAYATLASPALTGTPTAPTAAFGTNTTQISTTAFVQSALAATGIGYDAAAIPGVSTASIDDNTIPTGTYNVTATNTGTKPGGQSSFFLITAKLTSSSSAHQLAIDDTSALMWSRGYNGTTWSAWREVAWTDSPALTGTPTAPTASPNTNTTQIATTAYADAIAALKANIANPSFTGTASFGTGLASFGGSVSVAGNETVAGGLSSDDFVTIAFADDTNLITTTNQTGAIKIKLPVLYTTTQMSFDLSVNEGATDSSFTMRISGLNRGSDSSWQYATALLLGSANSKTPAVRFGNDGTSTCIWIGELADTWTTPQIEVSNIHLGNSGLSATWLTGWTVSYATTFDTVKTGPVTPFKTAGLVSPTFTGTPAAPTAALGTNTTQIATTAFVIGQAATVAPLIDGTATVGTATKFAREDHVHPTDTTRAPLASPGLTGTPTAPTAAADTNTTQLATTAFVLGQASSTLPLMDAVSAAIGTSLKYARADHVHQTDSTRAPLASPALTGTPTAPTAAVDTNTNQLATTAFVLAQAASVAPLIDGTATVGTSTRYARQDHVHPTDTTRAPLASPGLTGTPTAPTAAVDTNTTQIATTAFVLAQAASVAPLIDGTATVGTSTRYARQDHVHPTDTTRAPLNSPALTGTPTAPTPTTGDVSTNIATTAFAQTTADNSAIVYSIVFG